MIKLQQSILISALFSICLAAISAKAQTQSFQHVMDGRDVTCEALYDLGNDSFRVVSSSYSQTDSMVFLSATLEFFACVQSADGKFLWQPRTALQPILKITPDDGRQLWVNIVGAEALILNDNTEVIGTSTLINSHSQSIQVQLSKETLLTPAQAATLNRMGRITVAPELFMLSNTVSYIDGVKVNAQLGRSGIYRFPILILK